jgi:hypothetical protein
MQFIENNTVPVSDIVVDESSLPWTTTTPENTTIIKLIEETTMRKHDLQTSVNMINAIDTYFSHFQHQGTFTQNLRSKEKAKYHVCDYVLTLTGDIGYALMLKNAAKQNNIHLQAGTLIEPGCVVYVSISGVMHGGDVTKLSFLFDQCTRLLHQGAFIVADNKAHAFTDYNKATEGALYNYLKTQGYAVVENGHYAIWYPRPVIHKGPGSTFEYHNYDCTIRALAKEVRFIGFTERDVNEIDSLLGKKMVMKENNIAVYKPDMSKYVKDEQAVAKMVNYLRVKGFII